MSLTVKINGRSRVLGGGHDVSGNASNDKEFVWGELSGNYVTGGIPLTSTNLGLTGNFDFIWFSPVSINDAATNYTTTTQINANYREVASLMLLQTEVQAGDKSIAVNGEAYVVNFFACGNSAKIANLT